MIIRTNLQKGILISLTVLSFLLFPFVSYSQLIDKNISLGIDVLIENNFAELSGKRIALLTNHSGRTKSGTLTAEIMSKSKVFELKYILTPEHGFYGSVPAGEAVSDTEFNGVPVLSLYGANKKPDVNILKRCDAVVVDLQDAGVRSYTYLSSLFKTMQTCAEINLPIYVLDRPNPLGGMVVDGNVLEQKFESFVGIIPVSYLHGCTFGEIAEMINGENWLGSSLKCDLRVIKLQGWERWMHWEDTGLFWYPTSPHVPTPAAVRGMATIGVLGELGVISIGIGTTLPFQYIGSPNFKSEQFIDIINGMQPIGLRLEKAIYRPFYGMYSNKYVDGVILQYELSNDIKPYTYGIKMMLALRNLYPNMFKNDNLKTNSINMFNKVTGTDKILQAIISGKSDKEVIELSNKGIENYAKIRNKYLIYD